MKKKNYLLLATAALALVACTADDDLSAGKSTTAQGDGAIVFNMNTPATTRANKLETADAAAALNYEFVVWGEKNENPSSQAAATAANTVFENYRVQYKAGTANSTESNTDNWEYVGITPYTDHVSPKITTSSQTIKYWDTKATSYTFTAVSATKTDISAGNVTITKKSTESTLANKGYTITLNKDANPDSIYVADRNYITDITNQKSKAVEMAFRQFKTKIRFGFYETVPGYNVQITGVKYTYETGETATKTALGVHGDFVIKPTAEGEELKYDVTYDTNNKPVVTVTKSSTSAKTYETFGGNIFQTGENYLGKTSTAAVYDNNDYNSILPNTGNTTDMSFIISYKLISEDSKEVIEVTDRKVTVPAEFCKWKPNFAYTYLFKVSDASADLYPITFDAVVEADEVSKQETITEVAGDTKNVSLTTYATVSADDKTVVTGKDEYETGNVIYATTNIASGLTDSNTKLYTVTATGTVAPKITEASVANCLANGVKDNDSNPTKWTATDLNNGVLTVTKVETTNNSFVTTVPTEDGNGTRTINALTWTDGATTAGTYYYAVEFEYDNNKYYKIVKVVKSGN